MKHLFFLFAFLSISIANFAQTDIMTRFLQADSLLKTNNISQAYKILKEIKPSIEKKDTLYDYVVLYYFGAASELEKHFRMKEDFANSLNYGLEALDIIRINKKRFNKEFADREQWMIKNIIVSYFGLGELERANKFKKLLYKAYKRESLPEGIDQYFNFDFFTLDKKNIWGYEWYADLPDDRFSCSFTKIVYYVYSQNPDGTDKDQLYRLHVLMFHRIDKNSPDYVLTKTYNTDDAEISGTYYTYFYYKDIDYKKLKEDVTVVVKKDLQPDTKRVIQKIK